jgi:hypothetical protein
MLNIEDRGWWITDITSRPFLARSFIDSMTERAWKESNPEVGSSRKRTAGSEIGELFGG